MDKGIPMNGQPAGGGGVSMNGQSIPVAMATPTPASANMNTNSMGMSGAAPSFPMHEQEKMGAKCCGCCCDFRRAVIILDTILMILAVLSLLSLAIPASSRWQIQGIDDDAVKDVIDESILVNNIISGCGLLCLAVPVFGAMKYSIPMISYGIVWLVASFIASIVVQVIYTGKADDVTDENLTVPFWNWIVGAVITGLFVYPHVGLISEINTGVMSQATYPREEFSCCCGPPGR